MILRDYVGAVPSFNKFNFADKILFFAWYVTKCRKKLIFYPRDIKDCFEEAGLDLPTSISSFFSSFVNRKPKVLIKQQGGYRIEKSAYDSLEKRYGKREISASVESDIQSLVGVVNSHAEKEFLEEALCCFRNSAFRAAIVMTWNLSFFHFSEWIFKNHLIDFNNQLVKTYPKASISAVSKMDDFSSLKESEIIQVAKSGGFISNDVAKILKDKLDKRNSAAHPSNIKIMQYQAEDFITDLVNNVVIKLK
jgi:hypothetical protein